MSCVGFCYNNFLDQAANKVESSEKAAYPASNVYNLNRRGKVWRTNGFWEIIDGENTIVFRETVGTDLTATVAAGTYTSTTAFLAAVKAALEAAGVATYTLALSNTGTIYIESNLGGGATVFQLRMADANSADMSEILGFDATNLTGAAFYYADVLRVHTSEFIEVDLGFATNPKAFVMVAARNTRLKLSPDAEITLQANWTNNWDNPAEEFTIPYREFVLAYWNEDGIAAFANGYRYWRIKIVDRENPYQYNEFGAFYLGDLYNAARGCVVFPLEYRVNDPSIRITSIGGHTFSEIREKTMFATMQWNALTKSEEKSLRDFFETVGTHEAFFLIMDQDAAFSDEKEEWARLVKIVDDPQMRLTNPNFFQVPWTVREEV